jgi:hypothetical protein
MDRRAHRRRLCQQVRQVGPPQKERASARQVTYRLAVLRALPIRHKESRHLSCSRRVARFALSQRSVRTPVARCSSISKTTSLSAHATAPRLTAQRERSKGALHLPDFLRFRSLSDRMVSCTWMAKSPHRSLQQKSHRRFAGIPHHAPRDFKDYDPRSR